ncbi:MAG: hypothetical protein OQK35_07560 [Alphaproteobacteria bacterium]|nr:hypothetical protein [Rhodospirillales bacterium]MCW9046174.1 hypothetical protein [Alphaproteobacteria bacterium]
MSVFVRASSSEGHSEVIEIGVITEFDLKRGERIELLGIDRSMVSFQCDGPDLRAEIILCPPIVFRNFLFLINSEMPPGIILEDELGQPYIIDSHEKIAPNIVQEQPVSRLDWG